MKKQCKPMAFRIMNGLLLFNLLVFWSIRSMWSGIIAITAKPVPYILFVALALITLLATAFTYRKNHNFIVMICGCIFSVLFTVLNGYILSVTLDSLHFFIREFINGLIFTGANVLILFLCFHAPKTAWFQKKWVPILFMIALSILGFLSIYDISLFNDIHKTPVVYAVEDTYQITFTTEAKGEAWVIIDGVEYIDSYAGYRKSENTIHKITVPMEVLDAAGEYTVCTRAMYLRGPYAALQGPTISKTYKWKGVTPEDGINYYVFSDNHHASNAPLKATTYWGEDLDFLISCGDTVNWIDHEDELTQILYLASDITKGEIPVIYARGNHETKGVLADEYYNYVGADGENFYYTFRLKNIWGIVLDMGEDHADDYFEFSGMANFSSYRAEQTAFLDEVLANAETEFDAEGIDYRIGICHIPITVTQTDDHSTTLKEDWLERLNQMKLTIMYSGHLHELWFVDPSVKAGTVLTQIAEYSGKETGNEEHIMLDANFPTILVSKRGVSQLCTDKENVFDSVFIGVAACVEENETVLRYTNEKGEVIETISPWFKDVKYGKEIRVPNVK